MGQAKSKSILTKEQPVVALPEHEDLMTRSGYKVRIYKRDHLATSYHIWGRNLGSGLYKFMKLSEAFPWFKFAFKNVDCLSKEDSKSVERFLAARGTYFEIGKRVLEVLDKSRDCLVVYSEDPVQWTLLYGSSKVVLKTTRDFTNACAMVRTVAARSKGKVLIRSNTYAYMCISKGLKIEKRDNGICVGKWLIKVSPEECQEIISNMILN